MGLKKEIVNGHQVSDIQHTKPEVFILESLNKKDEKAKRYEGQMIADMLRLSGKNPKYYYFQSKSELKHLVGLFRESQYRYLHISSHASNTVIATTNETITYQEFSTIFKGHLDLRRLFFSACQIGNQNFVDTIAQDNKGMHSIIAPTQNIQFDHAAAIWSAFYISMFSENEKAMKSLDIKKRLVALRGLFPVDFFCATYSPKKKVWNNEVIDENYSITTNKEQTK